MTTTLNCLQWMQSQHGQNPCMVAQEVGQLCNTEYAVSLTHFQESSYIPNASTANGCTCSWSIYNLLSACSYCVGQYNYPSWSTWITACGSHASNTSYLPAGLSISQGIPLWAAQNPYTWNHAIFDVTQAGNIGGQDHADVTGAPLPTSTSTSTSTTPSTSVPTGAIVGGVIGSIVFIILGGLLTRWVVRRRHHQRNFTTPTAVPTFNPSRPATMPAPLIHNQSPVRPSKYGYTYHPVHSTPSLTSPPASPGSSGFSSHEHTASLAYSNGADMITPFLSMSPTHRRNPSSTSLPIGKAAEALREGAPSLAGQRTRLNPPPYSSFAALEAPGAVMISDRKVSAKKHKKRNGSGSGATTYSGESGHSRTLTKESASSVHVEPRMEQRQPRPGTPGEGTVMSDGSTMSAGGADRIDSRDRTDVSRSMRVGVSAQRPPAV